MAAPGIIHQKREAGARRIIALFRRYLEEYPLYDFPTQGEIETILAEEIRPLKDLKTRSTGAGSVPQQGRKRGRPAKDVIPGVQVD